MLDVIIIFFWQRPKKIGVLGGLALKTIFILSWW
jgi:hypothetical protein